jgi:hypothetical protein
MGFRDLLGKELSDWFTGMRVFPADIGHTVQLKTDGIKILCGKNCQDSAQYFFEHNGDIAVRCNRHRPALGDIDS